MSSNSPNCNISLTLKIRDELVLSLSIPVSEFQQFTRSPRRWLAYLGYCITNCIGKLRSSSDESITELDLDSEEPIESFRNYYYTLEPYAEISPIDPDLDVSYASGTSSISSRNRRDADFKNILFERDTTCVITNWPEEECDGIHLLRYSCGDGYIRNVTSKRSHGNDPIIDSIDDVRNGLLLLGQICRHLGVGMAFLHVNRLS
ncbi:hypothetical protein C8Q75DRAFT_806004 [Abortiporus biennis]|nr:hypothetical protein C8Q75DRAFT_806004 [Abortiporus biennis]